MSYCRGRRSELQAESKAHIFSPHTASAATLRTNHAARSVLWQFFQVLPALWSAVTVSRTFLQYEVIMTTHDITHGKRNVDECIPSEGFTQDSVTTPRKCNIISSTHGLTIRMLHGTLDIQITVTCNCEHLQPAVLLSSTPRRASLKSLKSSSNFVKTQKKAAAHFYFDDGLESTLLYRMAAYGAPESWPD